MIGAIKRGDEFAFEQAYTEFREKVYGYFLKKTRSPEDSRDLLQTTFLKLWKYRASLSEDYLPEQHIFQIARTVFIDHLRKQARQNKFYDVSRRELDKDLQPGYITSDFDIRRRLGAELLAMPELRKKVFELNKLYGYSYQEIARLLSISVKSVDNNLAKALQHLRKTVLVVCAILAMF